MKEDRSDFISILILFTLISCQYNYDNIRPTYQTFILITHQAKEYEMR